MNSGGLCAKGAGSIQLVNNTRRIGAWTGSHPEPNMDGAMDNIFAADTTHATPTASPTSAPATATWSQGHPRLPPWPRSPTKLVAARGACWPAADGYNSKGVAFFGSSHMNNESNYMYRKIIANFGTSNVEHQARI